MRKFVLHPLIHIIAPETSAQDVEKKKAEPETPHFPCLNQDIVVRSRKQKCGLKYVIHYPSFQILRLLVSSQLLKLLFRCPESPPLIRHRNRRVHESRKIIGRPIPEVTPHSGSN